MELRCCVESLESKVLVEGKKGKVVTKILEEELSNKGKFPMFILGKLEKY